MPAHETRLLKVPRFRAGFFRRFALAARTAWAAGSIQYSKTHITESNGGWHLQMTIVYGGKPSIAHVPMRFKFTPVAYFESYLDDKHGDKPQKRTIPLTGQTPINESVDVDFADTRGKIFDRTRFDFTITRSHNFAAGEYDVVVNRADGAQIGTKVKLILEGDNPVIDRRAISFVDSKTGKKEGTPPAAATAAPSGGESAPAESTPAAATESTPDPASSAAPAVGRGAGSHRCRQGPPGRLERLWLPHGRAAPRRAWPRFSPLGLAGLTLVRARRRRSPSRRTG